MLEIIKVLLRLDGDTKDELINALIEQAQSEFLYYCNREDVPATAANLIIEMVLVKYSKLGAEGLASQSFSGISDNFIDGYPANILKALNKYRKAKFL
jgi:hypothetical protein